MSRRSLRLTTTVASFPDGLHNDSLASNVSSSSGSERSQNRSLRQQHNTNRQSSSSRRSVSLISASNTSLHRSFSSNVHEASTLSTVLDDTSIQEQTELDHSWGLDRDDLKAGDTTVIRANGDVVSSEAQTTLNNGYVCNDCSMLSERSNALTALSAPCTPALSTYTTSTKVYSRSHKHKSRKAASGMFWWLGTGWYQLTTLVSLLNVFLLTRCLSKASRWLLLLIPLLLLLGLWWWGFDTLLAMLPAFSGFTTYTRQTAEDPIPTLKPVPDIDLSVHDKKELGLQFDTRVQELEKQLGIIGAHHNHHLEDYNQLRLLVVNIQEQMGQLNDKGHVSSMIANLLEERFAKIKIDLSEKSTDAESVSKNHEARILHLEALLSKLSEAIEEDRKRIQTNASEINTQDQSVLRHRIESLEREFALYKEEFLKEQTAKSSCDLSDCVLQKVDARVREAVQMMFGSQTNLPESIVQWISANYVSNEDLGAKLQELELRILRNITYQISVTKKMPTPKIVEGAVTAGVSGITEEEARVIVNNALKLYSQDRTGMVDYALESGGGSILGTRCSETYGTKTALLSLFGIPLWYLSQSPRVVIQPDMYPGNCWAFKGAQGYLVVKLSMAIYPAAFSLEHIPKELSPTGNITSAPKDFAVFGLEDEYQEDGTLLVQSTYDEEGEQLQTFEVVGENKPFQIVELRILSNWGNSDYTCLYRFRAHGTPSK